MYRESPVLCELIFVVFLLVSNINARKFVDSYSRLHYIHDNIMSTAS